MIMREYFNLPEIGALNIEHVFYKLDNQPILFICRDIANQYYLCSCCRMYEEWVVGQTSESVLLDLIDDTITIRGIFENHCDMVVFVTWDGHEFSIDPEIPKDAYPKEGEFLELDYERAGEYYKKLKVAKRQNESVHAEAIPQHQDKDTTTKE